MKKIVAVVGGFCVVLLSLLVLSTKAPQVVPPFQQVIPSPQQRYPAKPNLTNTFPGYQDYATIQRQLEEWKTQAPGLVETGTYGTSSRGRQLSYIRVTNLFDPTPKKKVLITACIHGNEPLACSTTMGFIGTMLSSYTTDPEVTELINTRDIYFVPVVCPDSYPHSRHCDGVDPNRNFPTGPQDSKRSVAPLDAIQKWFLQIRFNAAISGHTFGRVYLSPYGDQNAPCPNEADYVRVLGKMQSLSHYNRMRACQVYGRPIYGSEVDWYYRNGAFSIVCEYGTHQQIPSMSDTKTEFDRTYRATLIFIREAPRNSANPMKPWSSMLPFPPGVPHPGIPNLCGLESFKYDYSFLNGDEVTGLFRPAATVDVLSASEETHLRVMGMPTTNNIATSRFGELNGTFLDVFRTPQVTLAAMLCRPRNVMLVPEKKTVQLLQEPVDHVTNPR